MPRYEKQLEEENVDVFGSIVNGIWNLFGLRNTLCSVSGSCASTLTPLHAVTLEQAQALARENQVMLGRWSAVAIVPLLVPRGKRVSQPIWHRRNLKGVTCSVAGKYTWLTSTAREGTHHRPALGQARLHRFAPYTRIARTAPFA